MIWRMGEAPSCCWGFVDLEQNCFFHLIKGFPVMAAHPNGRQELTGNKWRQVDDDVDNVPALGVRYEAVRPGQGLHQGPASRIQNVNCQEGRLMPCPPFQSDLKE